MRLHVTSLFSRKPFPPQHADELSLEVEDVYTTGAAGSTAHRVQVVFVRSYIYVRNHGAASYVTRNCMQSGTVSMLRTLSVASEFSSVIVLFVALTLAEHLRLRMSTRQHDLPWLSPVKENLSRT